MKKLILILLVCASASFAQFGNATKIYGRPISPTAPSNGQALVWSTSQGKWILGSAVTTDGSGNVTIGTTCPGGAPSGSVCANAVYSGGTAISNPTVKANGTTAGTEPAINLQSGTGATVSCADGSSQVDCTVTVDTSVIQPVNYATTSGTNTYTASLSPAPVSYVDGMLVVLGFGNGNTGASTINLNSLGAKALKKYTSVAMVSGDLAANSIHTFRYGSSCDCFQMQGVSDIPATGTVTNAATLTSGAPMIGNGGADSTVGTKTGNTTQFATYTGSAPGSGNTATWDASGNLTDGGARLGFLLATNIASGAVNGSTTTYAGAGNGSFTTSFSSRVWCMPAACTLRNLRVVSTGTQPNDAALTVTVMSGANCGSGPGDTAITTSFPANQAATIKTDLTHTAAISAGDGVVIKFVNSSSSTSASIAGISLQCN